MSAPTPDFWLIMPKPGREAQAEVIQIKSTPAGTHSGLRMPFSEFADSALALTSFAQQDTVVAIGLTVTTRLGAPPEHDEWVGLADSPKRVLSTPFEPIHTTWIEACQRMGKTPRVIACKSPEEAQRNNACTLIKMSPNEHRAVLHCLGRDGPIMTMHKLGLHLQWYLRPRPAHRPVRMALVTALLASGLTAWAAQLFMQASTDRQLATAARQLASQRHTPQAEQGMAGVDWPAWLVQIQKLGKDERANARELAWNWRQTGEVVTLVDLDRPRKRLPKGCVFLDSPVQAQCTPVTP